MDRSERVGYAFAKVESWLEQYAKENAIYPVTDLSSEVGRLLLNGGRNTALGGESTAPAKVKRAYTKRQSTTRVDSMGRKFTVYAKGKHPYWSKMTPEERSKEMNRRMAVRFAKYKAGKQGVPMGGVA